MDDFSPAEPRYDFGYLIGSVGRKQHGDWFANDLFRCIPVQPLCSSVPTDDKSLQRLIDDGVIRVIDDGSKLLPIQFGASPFRDVTNRTGNQRALFRLEGAQADFNGELSS